MIRRWLLLLGLAVWCGFWWSFLDYHANPPMPKTLSWTADAALQKLASLPVNAVFDYPVRPPEGAGAWISMGFGEDHHLGEDWNTAGGDQDLGEPVYSCGDGWVLQANDYQSVYGKVVIIIYRLPDRRPFPGVEMMYSNLDSLAVSANQSVQRGQKIGTMGNAAGTNKAHLHWEIRSRLGLGLGAGYYDLNNDGWLDPHYFFSQYAPGRVCRAQKLPVDQYETWGSD